MRFLRQPVLLSALVLTAPSAAHAQFGAIGPYNQPRVNTYPTVPYSNFTRPGGAATNYGLVRPQVGINRPFQPLNPVPFGGDPRLGPVGTALDADPNANDPYANQALGFTTGHPATFFYYSHYFPTGTMQRAGGASGVGGVNNTFGRPSTAGTRYITGLNNGGILSPFNPTVVNPLGGSVFGTPVAPGTAVVP
jgi:hypothetical protein